MFSSSVVVLALLCTGVLAQEKAKLDYDGAMALCQKQIGISAHLVLVLAVHKWDGISDEQKKFIDCFYEHTGIVSADNEIHPQYVKIVSTDKATECVKEIGSGKENLAERYHDCIVDKLDQSRKPKA